MIAAVHTAFLNITVSLLLRQPVPFHQKFFAFSITHGASPLERSWAGPVMLSFCSVTLPGHQAPLACPSGSPAAEACPDRNCHSGASAVPQYPIRGQLEQHFTKFAGSSSLSSEYEPSLASRYPQIAIRLTYDRRDSTAHRPGSTGAPTLRNHGVSAILCMFSTSLSGKNHNYEILTLTPPIISSGMRKMPWD